MSKNYNNPVTWKILYKTCKDNIKINEISIIHRS